jgi:hypothetical protein
MWVQIKRLLAVTLFIAIVWPAFAYAQYTSPNYRVDETFVGSGGELNACSTTYCSKQTAGETAVGNTASSNFQANGGFNTTTEAQLLEVTVNGGSFDFGVLTPTNTSAASSSFSVRSYLIDGYIVTIGGPALVNNSGGHILNTLSTPTASTIGAEQFGINLRANSTPPIGADPQQSPDSSFSYGTPTTDYNIPDRFKFIDNDIIAQSTVSTGETDYTMTMITNISTVTIGGRYKGSLVIRVVPTY